MEVRAEFVSVVVSGRCLLGWEKEGWVSCLRKAIMFHLTCSKTFVGNMQKFQMLGSTTSLPMYAHIPKCLFKLEINGHMPMDYIYWSLPATTSTLTTIIHAFFSNAM
ncbi:hypothetical protein GOBAR_AA28475 [Gossypium barbadense]|uniref:Uncharacterized protein n=1 Tax=Gossypium barbadense TaxID=3634 RepID=A0A2P5WM82_GOSBA|nr:hypothetical protein GOBAR_AA28475 [Gossypium barbadense]